MKLTPFTALLFVAAAVSAHHEPQAALGHPAAGTQRAANPILNAAVPADAPEMKLLAGSEGTKVYLKWFVTKGWPPAGSGFRIYRELNGARSGPLNKALLAFGTAAPPQGTTHARLLSKPLAAKATPLSPVQTLLTTANGLLPPGDATVFGNKGLQLKRVKSSTIFGTFKQSLTAAIAKPPVMTPPQNLVRAGLSIPAVQSHIASYTLGQTHALTLQKSSTATATQTDKIKAARSALMVGVLARDDVATVMGSTFVDSTAVAGSTFKYDLVYVDAKGKEYPSTDATVTVGKDPQPAPPAKVELVQTGVNEVTLDWDSVDEASLASFGVDTYNVYRTDAANPQGILLTPQPVAKAVQKSADGTSLIEHWYMYADKTAQVGPVTYQVRMVDGLGRESSTGTSASTTVGDWAVPPAPHSVTASVGFNRVENGGAPNKELIVINAPYDANANYRIYRIDTEAATPNPVKVGEITQTSIRAAAPGGGAAAGKYRDYIAFDSNLPDDKHYRYLVSAFYPGKLFESAGAASDIIGIPSLTIPGKPGGVTFTEAFNGLAPRTQLPALGLLASLPAIHPVLKSKSTIKLSTVFRDPAIILNAVRPTGLPKQASTLPVFGETVDLKWSEPTTSGAPFSYKVYRTNVTPAPPVLIRNMFPMNVFRPTLHTLQKNSAVAPLAKETAPATALKPLPRTTLDSHVRLVKSAAMLPFLQSIVGVAANPTVMTSQVTSPTVSDGIVPSNTGEDYQYVIVPTNRWGVEGAASDPFKVHVPPTLPPDVPHLIGVQANPDNKSQMMLTVAAPASQQEVTSYHLYRQAQGTHVFAPKGLAPWVLKGVVVGDSSELPRVPGKPIPTGPLKQNVDVYYAPTPGTVTLVPPDKVVTSRDASGNVILIDTSCDDPVDYVYWAEAVNANGIASPRSASLMGNTYPVGAPVPTLLTPTLDATGVHFKYSSPVKSLNYEYVHPTYGDHVYGKLDLGSSNFILERTSVISGKPDNWLQVDEFPRSLGGVDDLSAIEGQTYKYRIRGFDTFGNVSVYSAEVTVKYVLP